MFTKFSLCFCSDFEDFVNNLTVLATVGVQEAQINCYGMGGLLNPICFCIY